MSYPQALVPTSVSVAPTQTTLATFDTSTTAILTVQVSNSDVSQTLDCTIWRRANPLVDFAATTMPDLLGIAAGGTAAVDIDCGGNVEVRVTGVASGAGLTAVVCGRDRPRGRS